MRIPHHLIVTFCKIDDFCKEYEAKFSSGLLVDDMTIGNNEGPNCRLSVSEIMTILVMFQMVGFRNFKTFYLDFLQAHFSHYFPELPSYQRFIELIPRALFPLTVFAYHHGGDRRGIYYIDSSCLPVCHLRRQKRHKTFKKSAQFGKTSVGWFYGLKLHIVINDKGQLIAFCLSKGNCSDSKTAPNLLLNLEGLAFGDKGYIGKNMYENLLKKGLKLITRKRKNMKTQVLSEYEKQLLNQRNLVETVFNHLKHYYQIWHTRQRSPTNAITHLFAALSPYAIEPLKMSAIKLLTT